MGQWISQNAVPQQQQPTTLDDSSMRTPERAREFKTLPFDPRSPTMDYNRTPILLKSTGSSQNTSQDEENSSPMAAPPTSNRQRSLHQRIVDKKRSEQTDS